MSRNDNYNYDRAVVKVENNVAKKFAVAGVVPFPEVDLGKASFITGISERRILYALRHRKLRGRRVGDKHLIRIIDLWDFAVSFETKKLLNKNHR